MSNNYNPTANLPWDQVTKYLTNKYSILGVYDLTLYFSNMNQLLHELYKFKSKSFSIEERILFYHYDTDFYVNGCGFLVYNLQQILKFLDIPQFAIICLTASYGITDEIHRSGKLICNDDTLMNVWESSYVQILSNPEPPLIKNDFEKIEFNYICLNGNQRSHRVMFLSVLGDLDILDKGIVTWNFDNDNKVPIYKQDHPIIKHNLTFLTTNPPTMVNDNISWNPFLHQIFLKNSSQFCNKSKSHPDVSRYVTDCTVESHFEKSFLYVITETVFDYPNQFITEKIFKAFINQRPFIVLGPMGTLKRLKTLGFKTFESIIDESYDSIHDPNQRLLAVAGIVKCISSKSINELKNMCYTIEDILNYNHQHYFRNYISIDLEEKLKRL